ncbi:Protein of unknown function DUF155 [Macleaya cordata]|uniref:DUF155 domain-containing protein n=1 Tax=Macleaya cordata TaxID=56857 RepID=A0A200QHF1_MACCD|nr:Protein of unknown function DUF155 [Macleaya cordata]
MFRARSISMFVISSSSPSSSIKLFGTSKSSITSPCLLLPNTIRCFSSCPKTLILKQSLSSSFFPTGNRNLSFNSTHGGSSIVRCLSSTPSPFTLEVNDSASGSEVNYNGGNVNEEDIRASIPVRAYFFSTSIDLRGLVDRNKANFIPPTSRMTNYVVLRFGETNSNPHDLEASLSGSDYCYMVVFQYGSIVLFNIRDHEVDGYLKIIERHASGLLPEMRKDEYEVREKPNLHTWMQGGLDYIMLQYLNIDGIRTIGSVLGQSIALDYYVRQVDGMVAEFTDINRGMEKTGTFTMERKKLFQLVGKANSNLADVILRLGLFERSDIAWKDAKYAQIWEYLRDEFELTQRFASLDFKLKFVEHNIRFLQEILQNRKSDFLEWLIIILIGAEILISVYDIAHRKPLLLQLCKSAAAITRFCCY